MSDHRVINGDGSRAMIKELKAAPKPDAEWFTPGPEILTATVGLGFWLGVRVIESETVLPKQL